MSKPECHLPLSRLLQGRWISGRLRKSKVKCLEKQKKPHQTLSNYDLHHLLPTTHTHIFLHTHSLNQLALDSYSQFKAHLRRQTSIQATNPCPQRPANVVSLWNVELKRRQREDSIPWCIRKQAWFLSSWTFLPCWQASSFPTAPFLLRPGLLCGRALRSPRQPSPPPFAQTPPTPRAEPGSQTV